MKSTGTAEKLDEVFVRTMLEIEKLYVIFKKHQKIRVEQWTDKLCQVTANVAWKRNRNRYAKLLLHMVKLENLSEPFSKVPPEGALPILPQYAMSTLQNLHVLHKHHHHHPLKENQPHLNNSHTNLSPISPTHTNNNNPPKTQQATRIAAFEIPRTTKQTENHEVIQSGRIQRYGGGSPESVALGGRQKEMMVEGSLKKQKHSPIRIEESPRSDRSGLSGTQFSTVHGFSLKEIEKIQVDLEVSRMNEEILRKELDSRNRFIDSQAQRIEVLEKELKMLKTQTSIQSTSELLNKQMKKGENWSPSGTGTMNKNRVTETPEALRKIFDGKMSQSDMEHHDLGTFASEMEPRLDTQMMEYLDTYQQTIADKLSKETEDLISRKARAKQLLQESLGSPEERDTRSPSGTRSPSAFNEDSPTKSSHMSSSYTESPQKQS